MSLEEANPCNGRPSVLECCFLAANPTLSLGGADSKELSLEKPLEVVSGQGNRDNSCFLSHNCR